MSPKYQSQRLATGMKSNKIKNSIKACDECRATKSKCDRDINQNCQNCISKNKSCTFVSTRKKRGPKFKKENLNLMRHLIDDPELAQSAPKEVSVPMNPLLDPICSLPITTIPAIPALPFAQPISTFIPPVPIVNSQPQVAFSYDIPLLFQHFDKISNEINIMPISELIHRINQPKSIYFEMLLSCLSVTIKLLLNPNRETMVKFNESLHYYVNNVQIPIYHFDLDYFRSVQCLTYFKNKYHL